MTKFARRLTRIALRVLALALTIVATIWVLRGMASRNMPELEIWHTYEAEHVFRVRDYPDGISLGEYRELEDRLFAEIDEHVYATVGADGLDTFNRYNKKGLAYAGEEGQVWNRSFSIDTDNPTGGILLLHGASDSPYSIRALAQLFADHGLYVAAFRLPGHGTIPAGLKNAEIEDWIAITRSGAKHVAEKIGPDLPLYMGGYSTGAALSLDYALDALFDDSLPAPDRLFLYSPSIAVTPLARLTRWDLAIATIPYFEKMAWLSIGLEYDPYKYNSFATNAGDVVHRLTRSVDRRLAARSSKSTNALLPPILAFKSTVDATVTTEAVIDNLLALLTPDRHELVLFDINRHAAKTSLLVSDPGPLTNRLLADDTLPFGVTIIANKNTATTAVVARRKLPFSNQLTETDLPELAWPSGVYSLSHVALPIPPDDPLYGRLPPDDGDAIYLGDIAMRGERGLLKLPGDWLLRMRYNPFYEVLETRALEWLESASQADR